jgi:hypothetical protein
VRTEQARPEALAVDYALDSTAGGTRSLSQHRGHPVVLFYEARERTKDNASLKQALDQLDPSARSRLAIVAAGDMRAFDVAGARPVARAAARAIAARCGFEILLDWKGALTRAPFGLDASKSNVVVVDRGGAIVFRFSGVLGPGEIARFFAALRQAG